MTCSRSLRRFPFPVVSIGMKLLKTLLTGKVLYENRNVLIFRVLNFEELKGLFESLKGIKGSAFQWRKLREASLISLKGDKEKLTFLIEGICFLTVPFPNTH